MNHPIVGPVIDGIEMTGAGAGVADVVNPATGGVVARQAVCDAAGVARVVESSARAFDARAWQSLSAAGRGALLLRLADLLEAEAERLVELELLDTGKPVSQLCTAELPLAAAIIRFYAGAADKVEGGVNAGSPGELLVKLYEPFGVVAGILPWNYPLVNAAMKAAPALAAGNTIVLKPSVETPLSTVAFALLCARAGLPPGAVNVALGTGSVAGDALVRHPGIRKVSFTGSTAVGQAIERAAAEQMKAVNLECGGKNAVLVFADADLERAAEAVVMSAFLNCGQLCVSCSRLLVEESVADELERLVVGKVRRLRVGDPRAAETLVGPMITRAQYDTALAAMAAARQDGCQVLCGGDRLAMEGPLAGGFWLEPTVVRGARPGMAVHDEEIFGPVLAVVRFGSEGEAVSIANSVRYGLSGSVWTTSGSRGLRVSRALDTGIVWLNTMMAGYPQACVPPRRMSGTGVELGMEGLLAYLKRKSVVIGTDDAAAVGWGLS